MNRPRPDSRRHSRRHSPALGGGLVALALIGAATTLLAQSAADMTNTKHNLSISGPGPIRADVEDRICVFCHTPHNSTPLSPLWNRQIQPQTYVVYTSPTLLSDPLAQPSGPTKLCLTCHDGTIALGSVVNPAGGITMSGGNTLPAGSLSNFGLDLSAHHPVSFPYNNALPNAELASPPPSDLVFGGDDELHCTTCHDPHDDTYGRFLAKDNAYSALCIDCHEIAGWSGSAHATSTASVVGLLPRNPPKTWPTYPTLGEWGCEACHTPHFAPTAVHLLNFTASFDCTTAGCHAGPPPGPPHAPASAAQSAPATGTPGSDIAAQIGKVSAHRQWPGLYSPSAESPRPAARGAACADCHNPHELAERSAEAPFASGLLAGVSGVDRHGAPVARATYEYQICFKCHGDEAADFSTVPRVVASVNTRRQFGPSGPSFHPVVERGRNLDVPSLPSSLAPTASAADQLYCSDCHAGDEGTSRGPHGSRWAPILKERYETADGTPESYESYALCYRCHERTSILADESFRRSAGGGGHSGHLAAGVACAACHDAHGIDLEAIPDGGSHTHLINFDLRVASPLPGERFPTFRDTGTFSGSCNLACHGVVHEGASYP